MNLQETLDAGFEAVKNYIERSFDAYDATFGAFEKRLSALEAQLATLPKPKDGKDADPAHVAAVVRDQIKGDLEDIRTTVAAFPALVAAPELPDIPKMINDAIEAKMGVENMERSIEEVVRFVVAEIPLPENGKDGSSVAAEDVLPALEKRVDDFLAAIPVPENGKDGKDGINGKDGAAGEKGEPGRDGLDVKDLFRAEGGILVATMSDGRVKELGRFVGNDGAPGEPGKDGTDGLGFDDLSIEYDGEKSFAFKVTKGERVKEFAFTLPVVIDRGIFAQGKAYQVGDGVTWGGHYWIAQKDTSEKPDAGPDWRLAVKRGRDGKTFTVKVNDQKKPVTLKNDGKGEVDA